MARTFADTIKQGVVGVFVLGVIIYAVLLVIYVLQLNGLFPGTGVVSMLNNGGPSYTFGLPLCAATAFAIVCVLERIASSPTENGQNSQKGNKLEFKAFGLTFSGPAGPVTLWLVCYLALVASMKWVKP